MRLADLGSLGDLPSFAIGLLSNINPFDYVALARPEWLIEIEAVGLVARR